MSAVPIYSSLTLQIDPGAAGVISSFKSMLSSAVNASNISINARIDASALYRSIATIQASIPPLVFKAVLDPAAMAGITSQIQAQATVANQITQATLATNQALAQQLATMILIQQATPSGGGQPGSGDQPGSGERGSGNGGGSPRIPGLGRLGSGLFMAMTIGRELEEDRQANIRQALIDKNDQYKVADESIRNIDADYAKIPILGNIAKSINDPGGRIEAAERTTMESGKVQDETSGGIGEAAAYQREAQRKIDLGASSSEIEKRRIELQTKYQDQNADTVAKRNAELAEVEKQQQADLNEIRARGADEVARHGVRGILGQAQSAEANDILAGTVLGAAGQVEGAIGGTNYVNEHTGETNNDYSKNKQAQALAKMDADIAANEKSYGALKTQIGLRFAKLMFPIDELTKYIGELPKKTPLEELSHDAQGYLLAKDAFEASKVAQVETLKARVARDPVAEEKAQFKADVASARNAAFEKGITPEQFNTTILPLMTQESSQKIDAAQLAKEALVSGWEARPMEAEQTLSGDTRGAAMTRFVQSQKEQFSTAMQENTGLSRTDQARQVMRAQDREFDVFQQGQSRSAGAESIESRSRVTLIGADTQSAQLRLKGLNDQAEALEKNAQAQQKINDLYAEGNLPGQDRQRKEELYAQADALQKQIGPMEQLLELQQRSRRLAEEQSANRFVVNLGQSLEVERLRAGGFDFTAQRQSFVNQQQNQIQELRDQLKNPLLDANQRKNITKELDAATRSAPQALAAFDAQHDRQDQLAANDQLANAQVERLKAEGHEYQALQATIKQRYSEEIRLAEEAGNTKEAAALAERENVELESTKISRDRDTRKMNVSADEEMLRAQRKGGLADLLEIREQAATERLDAANDPARLAAINNMEQAQLTSFLQPKAIFHGSGESAIEKWQTSAAMGDGGSFKTARQMLNSLRNGGTGDNALSSALQMAGINVNAIQDVNASKDMADSAKKLNDASNAIKNVMDKVNTFLPLGLI